MPFCFSSLCTNSVPAQGDYCGSCRSKNAQAFSSLRPACAGSACMNPPDRRGSYPSFCTACQLVLSSFLARTQGVTTTYPCIGGGAGGCRDRVSEPHLACSVSCYRMLGMGDPSVMPVVPLLTAAGPLYECLGYGCSNVMHRPNSICSNCDLLIQPSRAHLSPQGSPPSASMHDFVFKAVSGPVLTKPGSHHPHKCTRCQSPSFNLYNTVECSNPSCSCYKAPK